MDKIEEILVKHIEKKGFLSILSLLELFVIDEEYEMCAKIKDIISVCAQESESEVPDWMGEEALRLHREDWLKTPPPERIPDDYYIDMADKEAEKLKTKINYELSRISKKIK